MTPTIERQAPTSTSSEAGVVPSLPITMRAAKAPRYGGPEVVELTEVERPTPGKGEVLVHVAAAGLSRAALHLLTGTPYLLRLAGFGFRSPKRPVGTELAGTVVAVGPEVSRLKVGDEVFGYGLGTCAEYAIGKESKLALKPAELSSAEAAAVVDSASTALQAVRDHAEVKAGQRVLVLGASGGVGSFAVQIAKHLGATVTGTASTAKVGFVRSLGADEVVDHRTADPLNSAQPYDVIIDIGGNRKVSAMRTALASDGTLVIVGGEGGGNLTGGVTRQFLAPLKGIRSDQTFKMFITTERYQDLDDLAALVAAGSIRPAIDQIHPLSDVGTALERMESGAIRGKDVIEVAPAQP